MKYGFALLPDDIKKKYGISDESHSDELISELSGIAESKWTDAGELRHYYPSLNRAEMMLGDAFDALKNQNAEAYSFGLPQGLFNKKQAAILWNMAELAAVVYDDVKEALNSASLEDALRTLRKTPGGRCTIHYLAATDSAVPEAMSERILKDAAIQCDALARKADDALERRGIEGLKKFLKDGESGKAQPKLAEPAHDSPCHEWQGFFRLIRNQRPAPH